MFIKFYHVPELRFYYTCARHMYDYDVISTLILNIGINRIRDVTIIILKLSIYIAFRLRLGSLFVNSKMQFPYPVKWLGSITPTPMTFYVIYHNLRLDVLVTGPYLLVF